MSIVRERGFYAVLRLDLFLGDDGFGEGEGAAGLFHVEGLDEAALDTGGAFAGGDGFAIGRDDAMATASP